MTSRPSVRKLSVAILSLLPETVLEKMTAELVAKRTLADTEDMLARAQEALAVASTAHAAAGTADTLAARDAAEATWSTAWDAWQSAVTSADDAAVLLGKNAA